MGSVPQHWANAPAAISGRPRAIAIWARRSPLPAALDCRGRAPCAPSRFAIWNGHRSSLIARLPCTSAAPRMASRQRTRFGATSCGRFVSYSARPAAATCLRRSAVPRPPAALGRRGEQHGFSGETWTECHGTAARTRRYIFPHHGFKHKQNRR